MFLLYFRKVLAFTGGMSTSRYKKFISVQSTSRGGGDGVWRRSPATDGHIACSTLCDVRQPVAWVVVPAFEPRAGRSSAVDDGGY
jgi:hypothetical protein